MHKVSIVVDREISWNLLGSSRHRREFGNNWWKAYRMSPVQFFYSAQSS